MCVYVYCHDRSEVGMTAPVISRLKANRLWTPHWQKAKIVVIPGDRREAMRFGLSAFEYGSEIWHLGGGDICDGDVYHYDGTYRKFISMMARISGGKVIGLNNFAVNCDFVCGPTMTDDLPSTPVRPTPESYFLVCYNPVPWRHEDVNILFPERPKGFFAMPGNDGDQKRISRMLVGMGLHPLPNLPRKEFLRWLQHAASVWGNSSVLCYEAPVYHKDDKIHLVGLRNKSRRIVYWNRKAQGCPSDNLVGMIKEYINDRYRTCPLWVGKASRKELPKVRKYDSH